HRLADDRRRDPPQDAACPRAPATRIGGGASARLGGRAVRALDRARHRDVAGCEDDRLLEYLGGAVAPDRDHRPPRTGAVVLAAPAAPEGRRGAPTRARGGPGAMRPVARRPPAAAAGLAAVAVVGVVGCSGGSDSNHQTCGLVHDVVTELGKKHPHANVVKAKLGEIRRAARDAKDAQLRRLAPNLTPPSSTASDKAAG